MYQKVYKLVMPIYRMFLHVHVQGIYAVFSVTIAKQKG
jgi:hypothetical protein